MLAERASAAATSVLTLAGIDAEPLRAREHILLATLLSEAWKRNQALDLPALIAQVQNPPIQRIGVLDRPLAEIGKAKRAALVAEAYGGKALGGLGSLLMLPLRALPFWPKKKRLTDTYLRDQHITGFTSLALPASAPAAGTPAQE